ncbi:MAG: hypothetical protein ACFFCZ_25665 [Promethearchaeota archaeon]
MDCLSGIHPAFRGWKIYIYLLCYLLLQIGYSLVGFHLSSLYFHDLMNPLIWFLSLGFIGIHSALDCYIGWKWTRLNLPQPKWPHWTVGYIVFGGIIAGLVWFVFLGGVFPSGSSSYRLAFAPLIFLLLFAYDFFIAINIWLFLLIRLVTGEQYVQFGYIGIMVGFILSPLLFPALPIIFFYTGVNLSNWLSSDLDQI